MKTAAATAEELIRLALNGLLWWHVALPMLSPAHAESTTSLPFLHQSSLKKLVPALPATSTVAAPSG